MDWSASEPSYIRASTECTGFLWLEEGRRTGWVRSIKGVFPYRLAPVITDPIFVSAIFFLFNIYIFQVMKFHMNGSKWLMIFSKNSDPCIWLKVLVLLFFLFLFRMSCVTCTYNWQYLEIYVQKDTIFWVLDISSKGAVATHERLLILSSLCWGTSLVLLKQQFSTFTPARHTQVAPVFRGKPI